MGFVCFIWFGGVVFFVVVLVFFFSLTFLFLLFYHCMYDVCFACCIKDFTTSGRCLGYLSRLTVWVVAVPLQL